MALEGRYYHYLSAAKINEILAAEHGLSVTLTEEREKWLDLKAVGGRAKSVSAGQEGWPVSLANKLTIELVRSKKVEALPDLSARYILGTLYMEWGVLKSIDLDRLLGWFQGIDGAQVVVLCGSVHHLRGMSGADRVESWYPSRVFGLVEFAKRCAPKKREESRSPKELSKQHPAQDTSQDSLRASLQTVLDYCAHSGGGIQSGWVDFLLEKHAVVPNVRVGGTVFRQALLASPVWVADSEFLPPAGWYPDPAEANAEHLRWWNGESWTEEVFRGDRLSHTPIRELYEAPEGSNFQEL